MGLLHPVCLYGAVGNRIWLGICGSTAVWCGICIFRHAYFAKGESVGSALLGTLGLFLAGLARLIGNRPHAFNPNYYENLTFGIILLSFAGIVDLMLLIRWFLDQHEDRKNAPLQ